MTGETGKIIVDNCDPLVRRIHTLHFTQILYPELITGNID